jgi:hypothetical protein
MIGDAPTDPSRPKPPPPRPPSQRRPRLRPQTEATARLIPAGDLDRRRIFASDIVVDSQHPRTFFKAEPCFLAARRNGATLASWR